MDYTIYDEFIASVSKGYVQVDATRPNRTSFSSPTSIGKRYRCASGGCINTNGMGPEFFPGNADGTVESSTYSWYK